MKRFRLSTLMLMIVVVALAAALVQRRRRAARREAKLQARLAKSWPLFLKQQNEERKIQLLVEAMQQKLRE